VKPVSIASVQLDEQEIAAAVAVLRSGHLVAGVAVHEFETRFAKSVGAGYAVAVNSGTAALHIAYLAVLKPGDEVVVPGFTHISTASMVHFAGGRAVLCDVDRRSFTLSPEDAARRISGCTAAIAPVHLFGNACDIDSIQQLAHRHKLRTIWDASQAHSSRYHGKDVGSLGDAVVYSFYATKNMTTGEGGMIVTGDREIYERCKLLRNHGESRKYYHESFGLNYRMMELCAVLGLQQLKKLPALTAKRRQHAKYLTDHLSRIEGVTVPYVADGIEHSFHQYSILLAVDGFRRSRDDFVQALKAEGVEAAVHYPLALSQQPVFAGENLRLPNSEWLAQRIVSLPVHPSLSKADLEQVVAAVATVAAEYR
jgi:perosamine synthetase